MSHDKRGLLAYTFFIMMIFCVVVWIWTVAFMLLWPWEKSTVWKPEFRVAAVCAQNEVCGIPYGELAESRNKGRYSTLNVPDDFGEVMEENNWLQWKKVNGLIEAKASSWHFQTTIRYKLEGETPVLVEYQDVSGKALNYGIVAGLLSMIAFYLRKRFSR